MATLERAKGMGCRRLSWITNEENVAARALYESIVPRSPVAYYRLDFEEFVELKVPDEHAPVDEGIRNPQESDD